MYLVTWFYILGLVIWICGISVMYRQVQRSSSRSTPENLSSYRLSNIASVKRMRDGKQLSLQNRSYSEHKHVIKVAKSQASTQVPVAHTNAIKPVEVSPIIISREDGVSVTCDTRGNLGPCSVIVQLHPGIDWLKDRWQAASDMGGTAIPGVHWANIDFHRRAYATSIILDWETAFATEYWIGGRIAGADENNWKILYNNSAKNSKDRGGDFISNTSGQSPGVKQKMPLHVVHTIHLHRLLEFTEIRLHILRPAVGWGVSLWQFDVYGHFLDGKQ